MSRNFASGGTSRKYWLASCVLLLLIPAHAGLATEQSPGEATGSGEQREYYVEDIKSTMKKYIEASVDENGVFYMHDDKTDEKLALKFVRIHDPVRQIGSDIYFACTDFHVAGEQDKLYDLDFWINDKTGELGVYESKVHKEPRWSLLYGWYKQPRYTFVNNEIEYLY